MVDAALAARPAFAGLALPGRFGASVATPGVAVAEVTDRAMASLLARKGEASALDAAAQRVFGLALPTTPRRAEARGLVALWAGPGQWLAMQAGGDSDALAARLAAGLGGLAAVSAQGDGRGVLRLSGPRARAVLAKGLPLDLLERAFKPGDTALSVIGHMGVQVTYVNAAPTYEIVLMRSFAASLWRWLTLSAGEYGYEVAASRAGDTRD